jgi:hypothetical protein
MVNLTPLIPLSLARRGGKVDSEGLRPANFPFFALFALLASLAYFSFLTFDCLGFFMFFLPFLPTSASSIINYSNQRCPQA